MTSQKITKSLGFNLCEASDLASDLEASISLKVRKKIKQQSSTI